MPSTHSAEPATRLGQQLLWQQFHSGEPRAPASHRAVRIASPHTKQSYDRLLTRIEDLVSADRRKDESMAVLLHELRTPLASIQNAMAVLRIRSVDEALQQRMHDLIERQLRQIALLTSSVCPMSGTRVEYPQLHRARIDLCAVLCKAAETVAPEFTQRQDQLSLKLPEASIWVLGDASRLEQVFVNLLSNASKYSEIGGRISMSMQVCDGYAVVQVRDSGIGIAAASMPHIFDLYVRAGATAVRRRSGLGIGLALVRSIMHSHHGTVSAASGGAGQGSEFTVRLKLET